MPRGAKTIKRQLVNAAAEYKKGNRKEAYQLWAKASDGRKAKYEAKHFKRKRADEAVAAQKAAAEKAEADKAAAEKAAAEAKAAEEKATAEASE